MDETRLSYTVKHTDPYTKGICGIKPEFHITTNSINSLLAGEEVWNTYLKQSNNNPYKALKLYKGTKSNTTSYTRTLAIYDKLKKIKDTTNNAN
jgi:hypothetical protein